MSEGVNLNSLTSYTKSLDKPSPAKDSYAKSNGNSSNQYDKGKDSSFDRELSSYEKRNEESRNEKPKEKVSSRDSGNKESSREGRITSYRSRDKQNSSVDEGQSQKEAAPSFWSEKSNAKTEKTSELGEAVVAVQKGNQEPMLEFLDSMEKELGVEPDRVLAAFAKMPEQVQMQPASATQENFVQNLKLPESQEPKAHELYSNMLKNMEKKGADKTLDGLAMGEVGKQGKMQLSAEEWQFTPKKEMTPNELKQQQIAERNAKLDALSDKFFNVYPKADSTQVDMNQQVAGQMSASGPQMQVRHQNRLSPEMVDLNNQKISNADNPNWLNSVAMQSEGSKSGNGEMMNGEGFMSKHGQEQMRDLPKDMKAMANESVSEKDSVEQILKSGDASKNLANESKILKTDAAANMNELKVDNEKVRVEDLVRKADLMVKKGGGEMKMQLNPEGLGEVHMKVSVKEGKVDVQILTDNQQTKRIIESEMQNLKSGLAEGKLDLKEIKVDLAQNMRGQLEEQLADQQREHARQFLDFFRQNHGSGKNALAYASGAKVYQDSQNPEDIAQENQSFQRRRSNEEGRLSVVA